MKNINKIIKEFKYISREEKEDLREALYNSRLLYWCEFHIGKIKIYKIGKYLYVYHTNKQTYKFKEFTTLNSVKFVVWYTYKIKL